MTISASHRMEQLRMATQWSYVFRNELKPRMDKRSTNVLSPAQLAAGLTFCSGVCSSSRWCIHTLSEKYIDKLITRAHQEPEWGFYPLPKFSELVVVCNQMFPGAAITPLIDAHARLGITAGANQILKLLFFVQRAFEDLSTSTSTPKVLRAKRNVQRAIEDLRDFLDDAA
jgi:hypothetical protein